VAAINCGRTCREPQSQAAILQAVDMQCPDWTVIFLCEVDAVRGSCSADYNGSHTFERHWPGPGSLPLAIYIHHLRRQYVKSVCWQGRAVRVHLLCKRSDGLPLHNASIIFVHMAHGEEHAATLADVAYLIRTRPRRSKVTVYGDINVDQLPNYSADPFEMLPNRHLHHRPERIRLDHFCDEFNLTVDIPEFVDGDPGGPFAEHCRTAPISRIPIGEQAERSHPSLIDYALAERGFFKSLWLSWRDVPADHAWLFGELAGDPICPKPSHTTRWKCSDYGACTEWMRLHCPADFSAIDELHSFVLEAQGLFADTRKCSERSRTREPQSIKQLRLLLRSCTDEQTRRQLQRTLWNYRKQFLQSLAAQRGQLKVARGGVLARSKKMHRITKMQLTSAAGNICGISQDPVAQLREVKHEYENKWGVYNLQLRQEINDILNGSDGVGIGIGIEDVSHARDCIKKPSKLDHYGICPLSICMLAFVQPDVICSFLNTVVSSRELISTVTIQGRLFAKSTGAVLASKTRAILPLPAILTILDCILFNMWEPVVDALFPAVASVFIGARPHTQTLDIMHGLQGVIEKGLDSHGQAAIAQMDIRRYYDSIPIVRIYRYLVGMDCSRARAACLLRLHCSTPIELSFDAGSIRVLSRTVGALTGTRTAGLLGRIPVEDVIKHRHSAWEQLSFKTDSCALTLATYIDNLFSTGTCAEDAVAILEDCEHHLLHSWSLTIGNDSKSFMCARGCRTPDSQTVEWAHSSGDTFTALGHVLSDDGRIQPCVSAALSKMWRAFYGNFGKTMRDAPLQLKIKLLDRAVLPSASCRMSRWPYQVQSAKRIDRTQTKMIRILMNLKMKQDEDPETFVRRRNRAAAHEARRRGCWSTLWRKRVTNWNEHLGRERNQNSWAAKTLHFHGKTWLQEQRRLHAVGQHSSLSAGRTGTRSFPGIVHKRWHDGVDTAMTV
jgi:hypothetical protein